MSAFDDRCPPKNTLVYVMPDYLGERVLYARYLSRNGSWLAWETEQGETFKTNGVPQWDRNPLSLIKLQIRRLVNDAMAMAAFKQPDFANESRDRAMALVDVACNVSRATLWTK